MMAIRLKLFFLFLVFLFFSNSSQSQKKYVTEADYEKWTSMSAANLSNDGKWTYYNISNIHIRGMTNPDNPVDTLELTELETLKRFIYPFGTNPQFTDNNKWFTCLYENQLVLLDLKTQKEQRFDSIQSYELALNGAISLMRVKNKVNNLRVLNMDTKELYDIPNVEFYSVNPTKTSIVILEEKDSLFTLKTIDLTTPQNSIVLKENLNYSSQFRWSESGNLLAFYEENSKPNQTYSDHVLHCLNLKDPSRSKVLESSQLKQGFYLKNHVLTFTKDDSRINFIAFPKKEIKSTSDPLIWRSSDLIQPPKEIEYNKRWLITWFIETDSLVEISNKENIIASGDLKSFFILDDSNYLPTFEYGGYLYDINYYNPLSEEFKRIDTNFTILGRNNAMAVSPDGKYFSWIKEEDWWVYDVVNNIKYCMTCSVDDVFTTFVDGDNNKNVPFNVAIYTSGSEGVLLTSKSNIYKFDLGSKKITSLTDNEIKNVSYKMEYENNFNSIGADYISYVNNYVDLKDHLFIIGFDYKSQEESLYLYQDNKKLKLITSSEHKLVAPQKKGNSISFTLSNYHLSPQIMLWHDGKIKLVRQSNQQQKDYYWGHSEMITYMGPYGKELKGALFYPGNYILEKKYPVILSIYSDVAMRNLKRFVPLTLENPVGWNTSVFTTKDYFVFMPDVEYEINETGQSALKCVLAGVEAIKEIPGVDINRMGLFGHSFGGFEVSYIATQTNLFKTIICSAGWHDLIDTYTTIDDGRRFNYFRFEHGQIRIRTPYYSHTIINNSPIMQAYKIETPMLLIAGTNDRRVHWENSMKMQLALTRLRKVSTLLLYNDEYHVLIHKKNQIDLSDKIIRWCDYYLKSRKTSFN